MNWPSVEPAPKLLVLPPAAADLGEAEAAIELWEHYSRKTLDDDQRIAVFAMMAQDAAGKWAAKTTGREKPRQNGKGDEVEVPELWGLVQRAEAILHTVHDAVMLSTQTQERMLGVLEGHADLRRRIKRVWKGTGQQMIEMRNGGCIWYRTRTAKGGLGIDYVDRVVLDEAQEATRAHLAAISPTMLANPDSQLNALGTSGKTGVSGWWWSVRRRALIENPGAFAYVGTTAETVYLDADGRIVQEPVDVQDRGVWLAVNPAIRAGRGEGMEFLEEQLQRMGPEMFAREHLGVWDPPDDEGDQRWRLFAQAPWDAGKVPASPDWLAGPHTYAIEVTEKRDRYWIAAAGLHGDRIGTETGDSGSYDEAAVLGRLVELHRKGKGLVIDERSPARTLIRPLKDLFDIEVTVVSTRKYAAAGESFFDAHKADLAHSDQDPEVDAAAAAAVSKPYSGGWLIERTPESGCVIAHSLARWGHMEIEDPPPVSVYESRGAVVL